MDLGMKWNESLKEMRWIWLRIEEVGSGDLT